MRQTADSGKTWNVLGRFTHPLHIPNGLTFTPGGKGWVVENKRYIPHYPGK